MERGKKKWTMDAMEERKEKKRKEEKRRTTRLLVTLNKELK